VLPLIAHSHADAILAWRADGPIHAGRFLADAQRLAALLPAGPVLNLCADRYRFAVGLAASILAGKISLLPSTHTPEMIRQMRALAPDLFCIADQARPDIDLPLLRYPEGEAPEVAFAVPLIDPQQVVAEVFTSGSSGLPVPHVKRWGKLVHNVRGEVQRLGLGPDYSLLATVPPQHMFGLESSVLAAWQSGAAFHCERPLFAADICDALERLPRPRLLVTTPYHLRALLNEVLTPPPVDLLLSATAPLSAELAAEAEATFGAPLMEIYGCTETGQLATRRTRDTQTWQPLPGVELRADEEGVIASGDHVEEPTRLSDFIEIDADGRFRLLGRVSDLINVAGKRTSLAYLNHQLNSIPGVRDGVFTFADGDGVVEAVVRLTALVVAPDLDRAALLAALRERIDPVFLPRPLLLVDALPRSATGKLPNLAVRELVRRCTARCDVTSESEAA
jgi:acyl-coenzyme A synthetase/AMP-(fatty) acid ligase